MNTPIYSASVLLASCLLLQGCASKSEPGVSPKGKDKSASTRFLEGSARALQANTPVARMDTYLVGFHPMKDHPKDQMEAHHFCKEVNEEFSQCVLFDGNTKDANLNGIEYIISERLYNELPEEEKQFWHPHNYEIFSGQLFAPGLPDAAEKAFLKKKINSYGKTWHVWNTGHFGKNDGTEMPTGKPKLAWSFNHDGEALPGLESETEEKFDVSMKAKREGRQEMIHLANPQRGVNELKEHFAGKIKSIKGVEDLQEAQEEGE